MIELNYNGKAAKVYTEFEEITLKQLADGFEVFRNSSFSVQNFFLKGEETDEKQLFEFAVKWVAVFSTIPQKDLRLVNLHPNPENAGSVSLIGLLSATKDFLSPPERVQDVEAFKHKGKLYRIIEPLRTIGGAQLYFGNASFEQWKLSNMLNDAMQQGIGRLKVDSLRQLVALLYSNGDDSSEALEQRIADFESLDAGTAYCAWFFFVMLQDKYKTFFQSCLTNPQNLQKMKEETYRKQFQSGFIGKLLRMKRPRWEYLILTDAARKSLYKRRELLTC